MIGAIFAVPKTLWSWIVAPFFWVWAKVARPVFSALGKWARGIVSRLRTAIKSLPHRTKTFINAIQKWRKSKRAPLLLTEGGMLFQLSCQFAIIITLLTLLNRSNRDKGIATVEDSETSHYDARGFQSAPIFSSKIVWATVPAWIVSAYSALWSAMLDSLKAVHTDLELNKERQKPMPGSKTLGALWQGIYRRLPLPSSWRQQSPSPPAQAVPLARSTAKRTMLLDDGEWPVLNGFRAIWAGHTLLGICLCLRAALWTAGGLSAAIFDVAQVPFQTNVSFYSDTFFDEYLGFDEGDLNRKEEPPLPAFDMVSATLIRGGQNLSWTTGTHSFLPYLPSHISIGLGNYTFDTEAYWASTDCVYYSGDRLRAEGLLEQALPDGELNGAQIRLHYSHAGCNIRKWFNVVNNTEYYGRTFSTTDCGLSSGRARLGFFSGRYRTGSISGPNDFRLTEMVLLTCKPDFHRSNVTVTVSISDSETPGRNPVARILHFEERPGSREAVWPFFMKRFLDNLPTYSSSSAVRDVDSFGRLVIDHTSDRPRADYVPSDIRLRDSFEAVFHAVYSNYVSLMAYSDAPRREVQATLARDQTRLFVVYQTTYAIVAIVGAAMLTTLFLAVFLFRNRHVIRDHQELMLGTAFLLRDTTGSGTGSGTGSRAGSGAVSVNASGVSDYLEAVMKKAALTPDFNWVKVAEQDDDLKNWKAWAENGVMHMENPLGMLPGGSSTGAHNPPSGPGTLSPQIGQPSTQSNAGIQLQRLSSSGVQVPGP